jgi:hypothetical protein
MDIFKDVTSLEELNIQDNFDFVLKQLNLKSLQIRIDRRLGPLPEIRELQLANLRIFVFSDFPDFENLESFVKTQKKIGNFKMSFGEPNVVFDRIMTHVFGLESLRMVDIYNIELMNDLPEMQNDHVRTLNFHSCNSTESLKQYLKVFPKLTNLRVSAQKRLSPETILQISNLDSLEELRFLEGSNPSCSSILRDIKLPNLRKFEIYAWDMKSRPVDGDIMKEFIKRHPNVTDIKLDISMKPETDSLEILETLCENMKNLKQIKMRMESCVSGSQIFGVVEDIFEEMALNLETIYLSCLIKCFYKIFKLEKEQHQHKSYWVLEHLKGKTDL